MVWGYIEDAGGAVVDGAQWAGGGVVWATEESLSNAVQLGDVWAEWNVLAWADGSPGGDDTDELVDRTLTSDRIDFKVFRFLTGADLIADATEWAGNIDLPDLPEQPEQPDESSGVGLAVIAAGALALVAIVGGASS